MASQKFTASPLTRRNWLQAIGAAGVFSVPFLRSARSQAQRGPEGNFLLFFTPNGHRRGAFGATNPGSNFTFLPSLSALEPFRDRVTVLKGLCCKSVSDKASHEDITRIATCVSGSDMYSGYGPSIDQAIGQAIDQRPLVIGVEPYRADPNWQTKLSWRGANANVAHVKDPRVVFDDAFGGFTPTTDEMSDAERQALLEKLRAKNQSILDFVRDDITRLRAQLGAEDQAKLDQHLSSLREVEKKVTDTSGLAINGVCEPEATRAGLDAPVPSNDTQKLQQQGELHLDIIATAFACGTRRVATLQWQHASGGHNPNEGGGSHHNVSHGEAPNSSEQWEKIDQWYADRFLYALEALDSRGVLDNTVVVWCSEIAEQHHQNNFVNVVGGGSALGISSGQYIEYEFFGSEGGKRDAGRDPRNQSIADLWVSVQKAVGVQSDTFGDPEFCNGGLPELYSG